MDISKQFSLTDFLAYFFPGAFTITGIYSLILLTPVQTTFNSISLDITTGIAFLAASYVIGIIGSGLSRDTVKLIEKATKYKNMDKTIRSDTFPEEVVKIFQELTGISKKENISWSFNHYLLCRSFVVEKMPAVAQRLERLNDLALFRRNLILPILIWMVAGIGWGTLTVSNGIREWGLLLIILSMVLSLLAVGSTVKRMHITIEREKQYMFLSFIVGYKMGLFDKSK